MAFAPVSSWVPSKSRTPSNLGSVSTSRCGQLLVRTRARSTPRAVADQSASGNAFMHDSVESLHGRLGIKTLWQPDATISVPSVSCSSPTEHTSSSSEISQQKPSLPDGLSSNAPSVPPPSFMNESLPLYANDSSVPPPAHPWDTTTGAQTVTMLGRRLQLLRKRQQLIQKSYDECERITALFSKTFYLGTSLLSPEKRRAVWAIYAWCRRTDDLVDGPRVTERDDRLRDTLKEWERRLLDIFDGRARDALDLALVDAVATFPDLTPTPFLDMIKGMVMDIDQDRFNTFDDLYLYCYRVAGTVGLMTLPVMGTASPGRPGLRLAAPPALALGVALQLTNIIRDVGEDRLRGRIYIPLEDLRRFNYTEQDLFNCVIDNRYRDLIKFQIARARRYFREAQNGVDLLSPDSRFPVQASLDMYSQILDAVEDNGYDNFNRRAYISRTKKILTLPLSLLRIQRGPLWDTLRDGTEFLSGTSSRFEK